MLTQSSIEPSQRQCRVEVWIVAQSMHPSGAEIVGFFSVACIRAQRSAARSRFAMNEQRIRCTNGFSTLLETLAPQCWQAVAIISHRAVGFGCSGRCAPTCGSPFGLLAASSDALRPCDGGVLELFGVLGGRPSLASSSATRVRSAVFSATRASIRAISATINASFSGESRKGNSGGAVIHRLTHIPRREASPFKRPESIHRTPIPSGR